MRATMTSLQTLNKELQEKINQLEQEASVLAQKQTDETGGLAGDHEVGDNHKIDFCNVSFFYTCYH